jgi:peptidoglycan hydrolase-like protein with peptidoglycan-binding domain
MQSALVRSIVTAAFVAAVACSNANQTGPTPELTAENFTGTLAVAGTDSRNFTVVLAGATSDASVTVTSLTTVSTQTAVLTTIGIGFGIIASDGTCSRNTTYSNSAATLNQEYVAQSAFSAGTFCVQIFDAGTLTEPVTYALTVRHY